MNTKKVAYWGTTGVMCAIFLFSATMYLTKHDMVQGFFMHLGFPLWLIYPLAVLKILGVVAVLTKLSSFLKELAYAGFLYDALLATAAHIMAGDGFPLMSVLALAVTVVSWVLDRCIGLEKLR